MRELKASLMPKIDEPFELEIDGELDITPFGWQFLGPKLLEGKKVYQCRLLDLGHCADRDDASRKTKEWHSEFELAPGQARESFLSKFPYHNDRPVVIGGNEWQDLVGDSRVICLGGYRDGRWSPSYGWSRTDFDSTYLWLAVEQALSISSQKIKSDGVTELGLINDQNQTSKFERLTIVYRLSGIGNGVSRPPWFSKEICLHSFLNSIPPNSSSILAILLIDHPSEISANLEVMIGTAVSQYGFRVCFVKASGNCGSYLEAMDIALSSTNDSGLILLAEDDYLWLPESIKIMTTAFAEIPEADYITPYDHPVRYNKEFPGGQNLTHWCQRIYCTSDRHFRSHETTCMTFMVRSKVLRVDQVVHQVYSKANQKCPSDRELFKALQYLGGGTLRPDRRRLLLGPIPSLATHAHLPLLAPVIDWDQVALSIR